MTRPTTSTGDTAGYAISDPGQAAGMKERADCTVCAFVHVSGKRYAKVHAAFARRGRKNRCSFDLNSHLHRIAADLGFRARLVRRSGTVARLLRDFPRGRFIVHISGHAFAIVNGVIHDSWSPSKLSRVKQAWVVTPLSE